MCKKTVRLLTRSTLLICVLCSALLSSCVSSTSVPKLKSEPSLSTLVPPLQESAAEKYRFDHLGIVVIDIEKSVDFYSKTFGWKFEPIHEYRLDNVILRGKSASYSMRIAFARVESMRVELIEIVRGESLHTEFLKTKGQGMHHMAFHVSDLAKEISHLEALGLEQVTYFEQYGIPVMSYFETGNGILLELVQENVVGKIKEAMKKAGK